MVDTLYRRPLPEDLVAFSSPAGRALFRDALGSGGLEGYFPLAEQFHTQADPSFCGLGSLVVALNALGVDPGRLWKGPWRWYSEELLDCCVALDEVRAQGVTLDELACLARCNGAEAELHRAEAGNLDALRGAIASAATGDGTVVVAGYDRSRLGQTGTGHFSPVGGLHAARDLVLILDVARFKYPPHWAPVARLHDAMLSLDPATGRRRGWVVLRRGRAAAAAWTLGRPDGGFRDVLARIEAALAIEGDAVAAFARSAGSSGLAFGPRAAAAPEHVALVEVLDRQLRETAAYAAIAAVTPDHAEATTALFLVLGEWLTTRAAEPQRSRLAALADLATLPAELAAEVCHVRDQADALAMLERRVLSGGSSSPGQQR
jgi:glutathione gamma-glutamylcysteinyltransferase